MHRIWWRLRQQLHLIRRERSGILTISVLFIVAFGLQAIVPDTKPIPDRPELLAFYIEQDEPPKEQTFNAHQPNEEAFFEFDPNELDVEGFVSLGLSRKQAQSLLNYRDRSGGFQTKADLSRVYVLPEGWFERHESDIRLPDRQDAKRATHDTKKQKTTKAAVITTKEASSEFPSEEVVQILDINNVDSTSLVNVRGIGASSAQRILAYRDALGGFYDSAQYNEVWGLHPAVRQRLKETALPLSSPDFIHLNSADLDQLKAHPYISYKLARSLVSMRKHRGGKLSRADLQEHHLIDDELLERLTPYLNVE